MVLQGCQVELTNAALYSQCRLHGGLVAFIGAVDGPGHLSRLLAVVIKEIGNRFLSFDHFRNLSVDIPPFC